MLYHSIRNGLLGSIIFICLNLHSQLHQLDKLLQDSALLNAQIIGVGEASQGVTELQEFREELFWNLHERFGFNTIFLEAGYAECLKINSYLKSGVLDKVA